MSTLVKDMARQEIWRAIAMEPKLKSIRKRSFAFADAIWAAKEWLDQASVRLKDAADYHQDFFGRTISELVNLIVPLKCRACGSFETCMHDMREDGFICQWCGRAAPLIKTRNESDDLIILASALGAKSREARKKTSRLRIERTGGEWSLKKNLAPHEKRRRQDYAYRLMDPSHKFLDLLRTLMPTKEKKSSWERRRVVKQARIRHRKEARSQKKIASIWRKKQVLSGKELLFIDAFIERNTKNWETYINNDYLEEVIYMDSPADYLYNLGNRNIYIDGVHKDDVFGIRETFDALDVVETDKYGRLRLKWPRDRKIDAGHRAIADAQYRRSPKFREILKKEEKAAKIIAQKEADRHYREEAKRERAEVRASKKALKLEKKRVERFIIKTEAERKRILAERIRLKRELIKAAEDVEYETAKMAGVSQIRTSTGETVAEMKARIAEENRLLRLKQNAISVI